VSENMKNLLFLLFCFSEAARCPGTDFEKIRINGEDKCVKAFIYDISNPIFNRPRTWSDSEKECQRVAPTGLFLERLNSDKFGRQRRPSCFNP
jgi:hypothetical protein